jgi:hypothetical protein
MRFPAVFRRRVGPTIEHPIEEYPELGSDKPPMGEPHALETRASLHTSPLVNSNGFPVQRVAVACRGPAAAAGLHLPATLWLFVDEPFGGWVRVPGADALPVGGIAYFDAPCLINVGRAKRDDDPHNPGEMTVYLQVERPTDAPDGEYVFAVASDVSNPGC